MRILLVTDKFAPERGGSQHFFERAYAAIREHEVTIVTRACAGDTEFDGDYPHRVARVTAAQIPKLRSALLARALHTEALRLGPFDQVHCGQPLETGPAAGRLARGWGAPLLQHTFAEDVTSFLAHPLCGPVVRRSLRGAQVVTCISRYMAERLPKLGVPAERIRMVYPGVDAQGWSGEGAAVRAELGWTERRVLVTVSRLIRRKGHDVVLRALPRVRAEVPDAAYLVVGTGPEAPRLQALARELGVSEHVRFTGAAPAGKLADYYHAGDVFVMPNRELPNGEIEGFGMVFLEAGACGLPVIGGRSGGAVDAIVDGETGYLVDPLDERAVAERLIRLLRNSEQSRRMGEAGRQRAAEHFTWERTGAALEAAIRAAAEVHA